MENEILKIADTGNTEHYKWGNNCDGWHFVKTDSLSVIKERMPVMTKESLHYHKNAQQFFFILSGMATFEINGVKYDIGKDKGISIKPGIRHCVSNNSDVMLEFIVVSEPQSHGDRVNVEEGK